MRYLFFFFLLFGFTALQAQDSSSVVVRKDPRIDLLVKKQAAANAAARKASIRSAKGYRVLVVNTSKRDEAIAAKTKIHTNFPEIKAYLIYQEPFFKLKAGNFRTRDEAKNLQEDLKAFFPKGVIIIADTIEIDPEKADL